MRRIGAMVSLSRWRSLAAFSISRGRAVRLPASLHWLK